MMTAQHISQRLAEAGFLVQLSSELPPQHALEIADALLAAPALAIELLPQGPHTFELLRLLLERGRGQWIVGAGNVEDAEQLHYIIEAGAQFASSAYNFHLPLVAYAKTRDFLYIPTVHAPAQSLIAQRAGCLWQKLRNDLDVEDVEGIQNRVKALNLPNISFLVDDIELENLSSVYEAGISAAVVTDIYTDPYQSMPSLITRTRIARQATLARHSQEKNEA